MNALRYFHIAINTIFVIYLSLAWILNSRLLIIFARTLKTNALSTNISLLVLILNSIFHIILIFVFTILISLEIAVLLSSLLCLHWAFWLYFNDQRFASVIERPAIVSKNPLHYPMVIIVAIISSVFAIICNINWPWIFGLVLMWFFYGFVCAEYAIHKRMNKMKCDRKMAKFAINSDMGRNLLLKSYKYPFP